MPVVETPVGLLGAATALVAAVLGYLGTVRGRKASDAVALMQQMREWATQVQLSEQQCRSDMAELRDELEAERAARHELGTELEAEREARHELQGRFDALEAEMAELRRKLT